VSQDTAVTDDFTVSGEEHVDPPVPTSAAGQTEESDIASVDAGDGAGDDEESAASEAGRTLAQTKNRREQKKLSIQTEIDHLQRQKGDHQREIQQLEARKAQIQRELESAQPAKKSEPAGKPRMKDYEAKVGTEYEDYASAIEAWGEASAEWREKERDAKQRQTSDEQQWRETAAVAQKRIDAFKAEHPDYDEVLQGVELPNGPTTFAIMRHLQHSELGPALAYEMGTQKDELDRIAGLSPELAIAALGKLEGKIEARLESAKSGPVQTTIKKPQPPIKPVGSSAVASDAEDTDDLSPQAVDRYIARQNAKERDARVASRRR
jgi:hypothetical protein